MDIGTHLRSLVLLAFVLSTFFSTVLTRHHIRHHRDRFKRQQGAHLFLPGSYVTDGGTEPDAGPWTDWGPSSSCSRTCGGGVTTQVRQCHVEGGCRGPTRKHFSCNTQDCPDDEDYRSQQCSEFDRQPFEGVYYQWIPYTKAPNPCELNCMPRGERFYYRHKKNVADGTRCNAEKLDVCVDGKCQPVGCDMMLGSAAKEDKCRQCGGNGTTCHTVTGLLDMQDLQVGYNDILLIPAGATNIEVREIAPSNNYLAVRNVTGYYYLNGNWRIDFPKTLRFAGCNFHYDRSPQGFAAPDSITCIGPTYEPLFIVLLYQDVNVGVSYEYSIPKAISSDPETYAWIFDEFGPCTATCGGGYQTRNVSCAGRRTLEIVENTLCDASTEPASTQVCGQQPCEPQWIEGPWSECSEVCGEDGVQTREIRCERLISSGVSSVVNDDLCTQRLGPKSTVQQECNRGIPCPTWHTSPWKPCDHLCGPGKETRKATCYRKVDGQIEVLNDTHCETKETKPEVERSCNLRPCEGVDWVTSEWSGCDKCGLDSETRKVFCATQKGDVYPDELCEGEQKPELVRKCVTHKLCETQWYASQWSDCSANCGSGVQTRNVFCGTFEGDTLKKLEDEDCDASKKYDDLKNCTAEEEVCSGEWFSGPWSKCDKDCGAGTRTRKVICMKEEKVIPATNCDANVIPFSSETCNPQPCGEDEVLPVNTTKPVEEEAVTEQDMSEIEPDKEVEEIGEDDECLEWEYEDYDNLETLAKIIEDKSKSPESLLSTEAGASTESSWFSEDLMLSDSTGFTVETKETSEFTDEGSGDFTSPIDHSTSSDLTSPTLEGSTGIRVSTEATSDLSTVEGSGDSTVFETTESGGPTVESSVGDLTTATSIDSSLSTSSDDVQATTIAGSESTDESKSTDESGSTDKVTTEESGATDESGATTDGSSIVTDGSSIVTDGSSVGTEASTDGSSVGTEASTDGSSAGTEASTDESPVGTDQTPRSSDSSEDPATTSSDIDVTTMDKSSDSTDITETTDSVSMSSDVTDTTDISTSSTESSSDTTVTTDPSSSTTEEISTDSSSPSSEGTSPSSESDTSNTDTTLTEDSSSSSTLEALSTDVTESSNSAATTDSVTDSSGITPDSSTTEALLSLGESDFGAEELEKAKEKQSTESDVTETGLDATSESSATDETSVSTVEGSTSSDFTGTSEVSTVSGESTATGATEMEESTVSGMTTSSDLSSASDASEAAEASLSTEATLSTEVTQFSEGTSLLVSSEATQLSSEATQLSSEATQLSSEATQLSSEATQLSSEMTESSITTELGSTESGLTESTEESRSTAFDIWSSTEPSAFTETSVSGGAWGTTPYTIESVTMKKVKKCKRRKPSCKTTPFGCCYDMVTPAEGPFDKGCPMPKTCNETKFGCCEDEVSVATGPKFEGCPTSICAETLFGCCPDNKTAAEGNNFEGCKKEPPPPECLVSKFGCCEDNATAAEGPNGEGCKECEKSEFGCCPDGVQPATGKDFAGCDLDVTTEMIPTEDCSNSTFGCCPDGQTVAQGEHFQGCDIINKDNCTASYFGCCPDGTTAALGPEYQGCRMACEDEPYGCCPDRITAAHGPNQEGCCLTHPHGCCPDNIIPARGPNLEGCGCQYSPYGCCPDNATTARGYRNEGCGCQHTEHGCCPDRYTPAAGPDFQGCACHTFQFGCCPDGITAAKGPHKQGCGCRNTEFGCCSDDQTPAQGPDMEGCDCSSSKYGCCPDGVTNAQGENFDGCENVPINRQEACVLDKDRGSCRNYTVKWFFDMQYGGCSRFWYGGCDGNANRFMNMEECKDTCVEPQGKDVCQLPKVTGACEGYFPSWYYDKDRKQCAQFIWGGCLGNANRFETREECQSLCVVDKDQDACEQPKEEGPCGGSYRRWYFDKERNTCEQFAYGGCKPNNNNFPTEMACKQQCLQPGRKKDLCALPRAQGNCTQREPRWYFDASENRCMPFYYSGCEGNTNRFINREACELDCPTDVERDTCTLPALGGECHNYTDRWFYDTKERRCRQFYYGGCGGNDNNFHTEQACQQRCEYQPTTLAPEQEQFRSEYCFLPSEEGPCREAVAKWFYDSGDGVCKQFLYGGCQGNANNFETREECHQRCGVVQDLCNLPMVVGPCNSDYLQWFYEKKSDTCQEFNYGGCHGNDNRFSDQMSCESRCKKAPAAIITQRPVDIPVYTTQEPVFTDDRGPSPEIQICYTPVDVGTCNDSQPAWFYDAASQKCQAFVFTGCGGNANRFVSEEQCQRHCGRFRGLDVCSHPKDAGTCEGSISKWYYDRDTGRCQQFTYSGCGGSGNRFSFVEECESVCVKLVEPPPKDNDTAVSHVAICRLPVQVGPCDGQYHQLRWHFDEERNGCVSFIYSGCGGNQNNFKTYQACTDFCRTEQPNEIDVDDPLVKDPCEAFRDECSSLLCPYGTEGYVDAELCNRCRCYEPCRDTTCPEHTLCVTDLNPNVSMPHQTQFIAICRPENKEGLCPQLQGQRDCSQECRTDADCSGELKCCPAATCGTSCVVPIPMHLETQSPVDLFTTYLPAFTDAPHVLGGEAPTIEDPDVDNDLSAEEGGYVALKCITRGNPQPTITWRKDNSVIDGSLPRHRILSDGSLQVIGLYKTDSGIYHCLAENGIGHPARKDIRLDVTDPTPHPASVIGDDDSKVTVTLGAPFILRCYAVGWPRPSVTWWRGDSMLPLSSAVYEQKRDFSLLIRSVLLSNLGIYTCQAYNGLGKAASWSLTVQSLGPVYTTDPEDEKYKKYLVFAQDKPTTSRPAYPYRPVRPPPRTPRPPTPRPRYVPTPEPHIPPPYTEPSPDIIPEVPRVFTVPVRTNVTLSTTKFQVGSDISIPCDVDGHPIPQVQWIRNGVQLEPSESIQISESHRLTIIRANMTDSGEYVCEAQNEYSKASSTVNIAVEGIYIHPNCTDNPFFANCGLIVQARYCTHKYYARFCCKSCTQAGQLPSFGPHLGIDSRQPSRSSNLINKK